jgi:hypothetical protein
VGLGSSVDVEVLVRGARAAQNPRAIGDIRGITQTEQCALESERKWGFREQTEELKVAILVTACSAIIQSATSLQPTAAIAIYLTRATEDGSSLPSMQQPLVGPASLNSTSTIVLRARSTDIGRSCCLGLSMRHLPWLGASCMFLLPSIGLKTKFPKRHLA